MEERNQEPEKPTVMDTAVGWIYWVRIALSPIIFAFMIAFVVFMAVKSVMGAVAAALIFLIGCVLGYRMAENARKTVGTVAFAATTRHNVEFDPLANGGAGKKQ